MSSGGSTNLVGIDLGTTFSVIAHLDSKGTATTISNSKGKPLTPSVVHLNLNSRRALVGESAKNAAASDPGNAAMFIKRDMGEAAFSRLVGGKRYRPETLSAIILRKLKQDAEKRIGPISKAVITVPAFFDDARRKATEDAGRIAGLDVLEIINEPTAAALSYALEGQLDRSRQQLLEFPDGHLTTLVYDLGGGTFDVTVVRLADKRFDTLATDGAVRLGGKDWDDKIVKYVAEQFIRAHGIDPTQDPQRRDWLQLRAEEAKILLTDLDLTTLEITHQHKELRVDLSVEQFESLSRDLLAQTQAVTELVVTKQAGLQWNQVNRILLVGGSTRMPMVKAMLRRATGLEPDDSLDPDQVVARGAAIYAGIVAARQVEGQLEMDEELRQDLKEVDVVDVNAYSLGIVAKQGVQSVNSILIPKNTQLPFARSKIYRLTPAGAQSFKIKVLEGEVVEDAAANIQVGECHVSGLPPNLPLRAPIQVRLGFSTNGRISVMALDMTSGKFAHSEINRQSGLTEEDIRREADFVNSLQIQ